MNMQPYYSLRNGFLDFSIRLDSEEVQLMPATHLEARLTNESTLRMTQKRVRLCVKCPEDDTDLSVCFHPSNFHPSKHSWRGLHEVHINMSMNTYNELKEKKRYSCEYEQGKVELRII